MASCSAFLGLGEQGHNPTSPVPESLQLSPWSEVSTPALIDRQVTVAYEPGKAKEINAQQKMGT